MPVIHHDVSPFPTITGWCPWCGRETRQSVEVEANGTVTHWCHRCRIPRMGTPQQKVVQEGDKDGRI